MRKPVLTLFLTKNMSLKEWDRLGLLSREMALYQKLMQWFSVQIFSYGNVGDLYYESLFEDLKVLIIPYYQKNLTLKNRWHLFKDLRLLKQSDIIKTNQIQGSENAVYYSGRFKIPLVTRCGYLLSTFTKQQSQEEDIIRNAFSIEKKGFLSAKKAIVSSDRDRDYVIKTHQVKQENIITVPNFVDQETFFPKLARASDGLVLYVGRLSEQKNLFSLLEAYEQSTLARKLIIIGVGNLESQLKEQAAKLTKPVEFKGIVPNSELSQFYQQCNLYILPSFYEGLPKTLLEAMSCAAPCIGTDTEGIREVITNEVNGILCTTESSSIAHAIDRLLSDSVFSEKLGKVAHQTIKDHYSLDSVVELEKRIYQEILSSPA